MSCNVIANYVDFSKKCNIRYMKYFMGKYYDKEICLTIMDVYEKVRYYQMFEEKQKSNLANIRYYLKDTCSKLLNDCTQIDKIIVIKDMLGLFEYIMYFDGVKKIDNEQELYSSLENDLTMKYGKLDNNYMKEFKRMVLEDKKRKEEFISKLDSSVFSIDRKRCNLEGVYDTSISYDISFPKLYSKYAIDKVFHYEVISEDIVSILYYLVSREILEDMIKGKFDSVYLVDFRVSLFGKKDKLKRVLQIIDNDLAKEKIVIKILYSEFLEYRDEIYDLMKEGYQFSVILTNGDIIDEISFQKLGVFSYIIDSGNGDKKLSRLDNVIVSR